MILIDSGDLPHTDQQMTSSIRVFRYENLESSFLSSEQIF